MVNIHYQPKYKHGVTPKLPDDIVKELFIPLKMVEIGDDDVKKTYNSKRVDYGQATNKNIKHILTVLFQRLIQRVFFCLQLKYSKGFRAPTSDEMYFTFKHPDFTILPNTKSKTRDSKNKRNCFTLHNDDWVLFHKSYLNQL